MTATSTTASKSRRTWIWLAVVILIGGASAAYYKKSTKTPETAGTSDATAPGKYKRGDGKNQRPTPVVTAIAKTGDINVYLNGLGTVTPLSTVTVKSRVDGELFKVLFKEGQLVRRGDVLAEIDPRPFEVLLAQANGQLMHDKALLKNAQLDLERYRTLFQQDSIAKQQLDTQEALVRQYEGSVAIDQGQLDNAKLQLLYSRVTAPASGRVGLRQVDPGNVVHATDTTGIVIITQLQPISVVFSLPEDVIPDVMAQLKIASKIPVDAYDRAFKTRLTSGSLLTIDNQIDPTTGTVKLKAEFANADFSLFPNQFVNARLLLKTKHNIITVSSSAPQRGNQGNYVYVVEKDQTVSVRPVTIGITEGDTTEILSGLASGEIVVIDGTDKLRDGSKVDTSGNTNSGGGSSSGNGKTGKWQGKHRTDASEATVSAKAPVTDNGN